MPGLKLIHVSKRGPRYCFALRNTAMMNTVKHVNPAYSAYHKMSSSMIIFGYQTSFQLIDYPVFSAVAKCSFLKRLLSTIELEIMPCKSNHISSFPSTWYPSMSICNCVSAKLPLDFAHNCMSIYHLFVEAVTEACPGFTTGYKEYKVYFLHLCNFWESTSGNTIGQTYV